LLKTKKCLEIVIISLLVAISINIQRAYLLMKKREEKNDIDKPNNSYFFLN